MLGIPQVGIQSNKLTVVVVNGFKSAGTKIKSSLSPMHLYIAVIDTSTSVTNTGIRVAATHSPARGANLHNDEEER